MANDYIERMKSEHSELKCKTEALGAFIYNDIYEKLPNDEKVRMSMQLGFMESYLRVLESRIWSAK